MIRQRKESHLPSMGTVLIFILLSLFGVSKALAAPPILMKFSHQWAKDDLRDQWANWFSKGVEEKTKGTVKFEIYPASALFKPHPQFDAMRQGGAGPGRLPHCLRRRQSPRDHDHHDALPAPELPGGDEMAGCRNRQDGG